MSKKKVLIVGGTGYLGQHLLQGYADITGRPYDLAFTHRSSPPPQVLLDAISGSLAFPVDLKSGSGFEAISKTFGQPDVVVNCAAISVPRACEHDADAALAINVPSSLVKWLQRFNEKSTLLIHLSTDQVYEGEKSFYKEDDVAVPVNVYGKTKVEAEKFIIEQCSNFAILRSSIIYGPQTISPVPKSLPIQRASKCNWYLMLVGLIGYHVFKWLRLSHNLGDMTPHYSNQCLHRRLIVESGPQLTYPWI
ncbi:methionine adenosyltransferase 2 subunit beta-like isoform X2 [Neltuma alba]|uniref:methionine adenosyltransferase 2 subunit beta-like isoform X2 n=1 Tax=Neltuma alba TaxID=207710 RepID=UPI0010A3758B|nr:methionine adenosyltransferase 2 subunit beta-like isoform X2 [Prosopis alba]XP_028787374.1 methionine adenosyltransferase 2 subunit beta-like isoform X2 [Prosopis alba]